MEFVENSVICLQTQLNEHSTRSRTCRFTYAKSISIWCIKVLERVRVGCTKLYKGCKAISIRSLTYKLSIPYLDYLQIHHRHILSFYIHQLELVEHTEGKHLHKRRIMKKWEKIETKSLFAHDWKRPYQCHCLIWQSNCQRDGFACF